jgi:hypothetical protein
MAKSKHDESWAVAVYVVECTVIFCGLIAMMVVLMLH